MTRIGKLAVVSAFLLAGTAFGQAPTGAPHPPAGVGWSLDGNAWQPAAPAVESDAHASEGWRFFGNGDAHGEAPWRFFGSAGYFLGWVKGDPLPPLITASAAGTAQTSAGVLNTPGTGVVFGNERINTQVRSGIRATLGAYLDPEGQYAVELGFFGMESASTGYQAASDGTQILGRPYSDVTTGMGAAAVIAYPGVSTGSVRAVESARNLYGWNLDVRESFFSSSWVRVDALLGYRFLRYDEHLQVQSTISPTSGPFTTGTVLSTTDNFGSRNIFNGIDLGFRSEFYYGAFSLETYGKVAVGVLNRTTNIFGSQVSSVPGAAPATTGSGLLALASNSGTHSGHTDTGIPEVGFNLGYQITDNIRFQVGYSVLWWMNLVRPGNAVDTTLNPGLIPGGSLAAGSTTRPTLTGQYSDLWVQAVNFSLEVRY